MDARLVKPTSPLSGPRLLALSSPVMGSGKSEVANRLVKEHGFVLVKFAGPVKKMVEALLVEAGLPSFVGDNPYTEGPFKEQPLSPLCGASTRFLMQTLGTEWGRHTIAEGLWLQIAANKITQQFAQGRHVVVDDLRFSNEFALIQALGGVSLRVIRAGMLHYAAHSSEGGLDGIQMPELHNAGSLADLHRAADEIATGEIRLHA